LQILCKKLSTERFPREGSWTCFPKGRLILAAAKIVGTKGVTLMSSSSEKGGEKGDRGEARKPFEFFLRKKRGAEGWHAAKKKKKIAPQADHARAPTSGSFPSFPLFTKEGAGIPHSPLSVLIYLFDHGRSRAAGRRKKDKRRERIQSTRNRPFKY